MKGLSRKNFSQAGRRSMIGSLQLAIQRYRSGSTTVATPITESLDFAEIAQLSLPQQPIHSTHPKLLNAGCHSSY